MENLKCWTAENLKEVCAVAAVCILGAFIAWFCFSSATEEALNKIDSISIVAQGEEQKIKKVMACANGDTAQCE